MKIFSKQIESYISGELNGDELLQFEKELAVNYELQRKVKVYRELFESAKEDDIFALRNKLNISHSLVKRTRQRHKVASLAAVASIALLFFIGFQFFFSTPNHIKIFNEHFQPYQIIGEARSSQSIESSVISSELQSLYLSRKFEDAIPILLSYLNRYQNDRQAVLMLSTCYIETNNAEKAEELLKALIRKDENEIFVEIAKWYLSLSQIKMGKIDEAKDLLKEIYNYQGFYSSKAKLILDSI
jgi:predicted negative regulator of RcsB-dependent stress response